MRKRLKLIGVFVVLFVLFEVLLHYNQEEDASPQIVFGKYGRIRDSAELSLAELLADRDLMEEMMKEELEGVTEEYGDILSERTKLSEVLEPDQEGRASEEKFSEEDPTEDNNHELSEEKVQLLEDLESFSEDSGLPEDVEQSSEEGRLLQGLSNESLSSNNSSITSDIMVVEEEAMVEGERRAVLVQKRCEEVRNHKTFPINPKFRIEKRIFFAKREKLAYCSVAKAFSSSLKRIFLVLSKGGTAEDIAANSKLLTDIKYPHYVNYFKNDSLLFHYPEDQWKQVLDSHYLFAFVRDPVEKVISAYRDKFFSKTKDAFHEYFKNSYGKDICRSMTDEADQMEQLSATNYNCSADTPFFDLKAFLSWHFLIHDKVMGEGVEFNPHWGSDISICRLCDPDYHYRFIGHFESGDKDMTDLFSRAGWNFPLSPPQQADMKLDDDEKEAFKKNVSILPQELMNSLYQSVALERYVLGYTDENPLL